MRLLSLLSNCVVLATALACSGVDRPLGPAVEGQAVNSPAGKSPDAPTSSPSAPLVGSFDLQSIGGRPVPLSYSGGGSSWEIIGGRYELMADGTYYFYYRSLPDNGRPSSPTGWYTVSNGTIYFYYAGPVGPFYLERNRLFSTGIVSGNVMVVEYEDFIDFETEVYSRH